MAPFGAPNVERLAAKRNVTGLIRALRYEKAQSIRITACRALGAIGDARAVDPLIGALNDSDKEVRQAAVLELGAMGDARAVEPLIGALNDRDGLVRGFAALALGTIGDARAVDPLIGALWDEDHDVREHAAEVLARRGWQPSRGEAGAAYWIARAEWDRCVQVGEAAVEPLIHALNDQDHLVRMRAASALGAIGDARAVDPLIHALNNSAILVRMCAASALGSIGDARAVEPLIGALNDHYWDVRQAAASALEAMGDARAKEPLKRALNDRVKALVRRLGRSCGDPAPGTGGLWHRRTRDQERDLEELRGFDPAVVVPLVEAELEELDASIEMSKRGLREWPDSDAAQEQFKGQLTMLHGGRGLLRGLLAEPRDASDLTGK